MAEFAKRPEVTVNTMGKVHNPTGEGVRAISTQVQAKSAKLKKSTTPDLEDDSSAPSKGTDATTKSSNHPKELHETKVKEGTAKRNITRKKTDSKDSGNYDSRNKKQGGHGKGQWKDVCTPDAILDDNLPDFDEKDPLFDDHEKPYILSAGVPAVDATEPEAATTTNGTAVAGPRGFDPIARAKIYGPMLTLAEFKIQLASTLKEYFDSCDADEVIRSLGELKCQEYHPEIVKKAVSISLDQGPRERELVSRLLTCLLPSLLSLNGMEAGFKLLLDSLDDLITDVPEAKTMVASFLARAVVDEVLPPAFLSEQNNERPGDEVVEKAVTLLSREHCTARLERVWGPGDGRPVAELKQEMDQLLHEYLLSRELDEAARCVRELNVNHFHHELVKRGVVIAMEQPSNEEALDAMAALFTFLVKNAIVSEYQVVKGISRLHLLLPDLTLDVPTAASLLHQFETFMSHENGGCLTLPAKTDVIPTTSNGHSVKAELADVDVSKVAPENGSTGEIQIDVPLPADV